MDAGGSLASQKGENDMEEEEFRTLALAGKRTYTEKQLRRMYELCEYFDALRPASDSRTQREVAKICFAGMER